MGAIILLLAVGGFLWFLWYLFYKSVVWVLQPVADYMKQKDEEKFTIKNQSPVTINIVIQNLGTSVSIPKPTFDKAQHKPQKLAGTDLWIYKDSILNFKSARDKLLEILRDEKESDGEEETD